MSRPRKPRKLSALNPWQRLICFVVVVAPPVALAGRMAYGFLDYLDAVLAKSAPLVAAFASGSLGREVQIGELTPFLSVAELWSYYRRLDKLGTIPVIAKNVTIANGKTLAGSGELASVQEARAFVSVPALLSGNANSAVVRLELESLRLFLIRRQDGSFNVQELVKEEKKPSGLPFLTSISISNADLRIEDHATRFRTPQTNEFFPLNGNAILGARSLRFTVQATPRSGTALAKRLRGAVQLMGTVAQGNPGSRVGASLPSDPQYTMRASILDADIAYFARYLFGNLPNVNLTSGRATQSVVTMIGPLQGQIMEAHAHHPNTQVPWPSILFNGTFRDISGRVNGIPAPVNNVAGTIRYAGAGDLVSFDLTGSVFASPLALSGSVWNLTQSLDGLGPRLAIRFNAPTIPLSRILPAWKIALPEGISVAGAGKASGFLMGTPNNLAGSATVGVPRINIQGKTTIQDVSADLSYGNGLLQATRLTAQTDLGGVVSGSGSFRFAELSPDGKTFQMLPQTQIASNFSVSAKRLSLPHIASLVNASPTAKKVSLAGSADVVASGNSYGKQLSLTADIDTQGFSVSHIPFSVAKARIVIRDNVVYSPLARFESPLVGSLFIRGDSKLLNVAPGANTPLAIQFSANALDAGRLATVFGFSGVGGVVNADGTVRGTVAAPQLNLDRITVMNPRYKQYAIQSVTGSHITATRDTITIPDNMPLVARRFPAVLRVTGQIKQFLPGTTNAPVRPLLALNARVTNVDYSTIAPFLPQPASGTKSDVAPFAGTLTQANVRISGLANNPRLVGNGSLRRVLLGDYPVETGEFQFDISDGLIRIPSLTATASAGTVTAKGTITRSGYVYGSFLAPAIDLSRLSYLTEKTATLGGAVSVTGTFSGTRSRPIVTASMDSSSLNVAGIEINNLAATNIRYIANLEQNVQRIEVPRIALEQKGATRLLLEGGAYDFKRKQFNATVTFRSGNVNTLISSLRESAFARTQPGRQALASLESLPRSLDAKFPDVRFDAATKQFLPTNTVAISGDLSTKGLGNYRVKGDIYAENLVGGQYTADTVHIALDKGSDAVVPPGQPNIGAQITATNIKVGDFTFTDLLVNGSYVGETATIADGSRIVSPSGTVKASGTADFGKEGQINATIESNDLPLDFIRVYVPTLPLSGSVSLIVSARGATKAPDLQASLDGQNIDIVSRNVAGQQNTTIDVGLETTDASKIEPVRLSHIRAIARITRDKNGKRFFELSDTQVERQGGGSLEAEARLPFSYEAPYISPTEPVSLSLRFPRQDLKLISLPALDAFSTVVEKNKRPESSTASGFTGGYAEGEITLAGTLREPNLSGRITIQEAGYQFKRRFGKETLNAISNADALITLNGSNVHVDSSLTLAKPNGGRGNNGTMTVAGDITISELETALNQLSNRARKTPAIVKDTTKGTSLNLLATFNSFEPLDNNFFNLKEYLRGKVDGKLTVQGSLTQPKIATLPGAPLQVKNVNIIPPTQKEDTNTNQQPQNTGPEFAIQIDAPSKNTITLAGLLVVDVSGSASIKGYLGNPVINGRFLTKGGSLQYFLGRFVIDKNAPIALQFSGNSGSISMDKDNPVTARTKAYLRPGASLSGESQTRGGLPIASTQPSADGNGTRYNITAQLGGAIFFGANADASKNTFNFKLLSDPYLPESQIYALLVPRTQLANAISGDFSNAGKDLVTTIFNQSVLPGLFSPIEDRLASTFGLEQFTVDYSPSAPVTVNVLKRLPDPLNRFLVSYSRSVPTSSTRNGTQVPFTAGFLFELLQLRSRPNQPIPRIQFGFFTNEQRDFSGSLRATIIY